MYQVHELRPDGTMHWYDESSRLERAKLDCATLAEVLYGQEAKAVVTENGVVVYEAPIPRTVN